MNSKDISEQKQKMEFAIYVAKERVKTIQRLHARQELLVEALRFYANLDNWEPNEEQDTGGHPVIYLDNGQTAQAALRAVGEYDETVGKSV